MTDTLFDLPDSPSPRSITGAIIRANLEAIRERKQIMREAEIRAEARKLKRNLKLWNEE